MLLLLVIVTISILKHNVVRPSVVIVINISPTQIN
jgi:hypothetical protein